ncbi:MAG: FMN-binding negative transcriptional regulator [Bryobacteraceae bacterium]
MYVPSHFDENRIDVLHDLIRGHSLAALITLGQDGFIANHIPLIVDPEPAPFGTLRGHLAKANPQWKESRPDVPALAIFQGASAYITPSWYPSKMETGKVVPTYNYAVVHAHGPLRIFDDPGVLERHLRKLTAAHESVFPRQWSVDDAPASYISGLLKGIVGIEIPIARLEGKWKCSQNRSLADQAGVVDGLASSPDAVHQEMARLISQNFMDK